MTPSTPLPAGSQDAHLAFARRMDRIDGLGHYRARFVGTEAADRPAGQDSVVYLDGNSLGRPTLASVDRITEFLTGA